MSLESEELPQHGCWSEVDLLRTLCRGFAPIRIRKPFEAWMRETPKLNILHSMTRFAGLVGFSTGIATADVVDTTNIQVLATARINASAQLFDHLGKSPIVITPAEWEGRGLSLGDILATHAGIQTRRTGGMGSFQDISIRGVAGNKVLICIDGIPLTDALGMSVNLGSFDLNQFEKVEVYQGQVPAQFGGNGIGGVVNLVSRKNLHGSGRIYASYGSHNTGETSMNLSSPLTDSIRWTSALSWRFSDNDYRYFNRNGTEYNTDDDHWDTRHNAQFNQFGGNHQWNWITAHGEFRLQVSHSQQNGGMPGNEAQDTKVAGFEQSWITPKLTWILTPWANGIRMESEIAGTVDKSTTHWSNELDLLGYSGSDANYQQVGGRTLRANGALRFFGEWHEPYALEWHLTGSGEQLDPRDKPQSIASYRWQLQRHQVNSALEASYAPMTWIALRINHQISGVVDHNSGGVIHTSFPDTLPAERKINVKQAAQGTLHIGKPEGIARGFVSGGHHYRIPALQELFSTNLGIIANPNLKPESGENAECGFEMESKHHRLKANLFWNQVRNGIFWERSAGFMRPDNLSRSETIGFTLEAYTRPVSFFELSTQATIQNPRNRSNNEAYEDNLSPNEPKLALGTEGTFHLGKRWSIGYRLDWRSELFRDQANQMRIGPQANHNASVAFIPWAKANMRFAVNNIADSDIQDIYMAYPTPGRQYFFSLTQEF